MSTSKTTSHRWAFAADLQRYDTASPWGPIDDHGFYTKNGVLTATDSVTYGSNYADWRRRLVLGQNATTTLTGTRFGHVQIRGGVADKYHNGHLQQHYYGNLGCNYLGFNNPTQSMSSIADQRARQKFLSHYISAKNSWRGANFVAEIGETIHMLRHPVSSLFGSVMDFAKYVAGRRSHNLGKKSVLAGLDKANRIIYQRRGVNPHGEAKFVKKLDRSVSDTWLTWAFGVKPLIADCNDAGVALNNLKNRLGGTGVAMQRVKGHGRETTVVKTLRTGINFVTNDPGTGFSAEQIDKTDLDVRYVAGLRARLEDPSTVLEHFGFDPYDVVPAVWEAIPWSFFIDYFVNVQEMIDSCRLWSADFSYCYRSVRNAGTRNFLRPYPTAMPTATDQRYCSGGGFYTLSTWVSRSPIGSVPQPSFEMRIPGIDSSKWLNIAALKEQIFKASGKRH